MKIYTKTGDKGETGLVGARARKDSLRVEAYGAIDEANSVIGLVQTALPETSQDIKVLIEKIQHELFDCGGDLAIVNGVYPYKVKDSHVKELEEAIDLYMSETPPLRRFILPGGTLAASYLHMARATVRRAERRIVSLKFEEEMNEQVLIYINRLSDLLFALARVCNARSTIGDVEYIRGGDVFRTEKKEG